MSEHATTSGKPDFMENAWQTACHVWQTESREVERLSSSTSRETFERCLHILKERRGRIITSGAGTSAAAARKIAHTLCCINQSALFLVPSDALHGGMGIITAQDVLVLISKGGGTKELTQLLPGAKVIGCTIIAVTENEHSELAKAAHLTVRIKVEREPDPFNMLATASTMAVVAYFDAVCIALMQAAGYSQDQFAVIHPSGAVGDRLTGKAK